MLASLPPVLLLLVALLGGLLPAPTMCGRHGQPPHQHNHDHHEHHHEHTESPLLPPPSPPISMVRICTALCCDGLGGTPCDVVFKPTPTKHGIATTAASDYSNHAHGGGGNDAGECEMMFERAASRVRAVGGGGSSATSSPTGLWTDEKLVSTTTEGSAAAMMLRPEGDDAPAGGGTPRRDVCGELCVYGLGHPFCECRQMPLGVNTIRGRNKSPAFINFHKVCKLFCSQHEYQLDGCPRCSMEGDNRHPGKPYGEGGIPADRSANNNGIDWNAWCRERCAEGDGGVACNCDILPFNIEI